MKRPRVGSKPDRTHYGHLGQNWHSVNDNYKKCSPVNFCKHRFNSDNICEIDRDSLLNLNKTCNVFYFKLLVLEQSIIHFSDVTLLFEQRIIFKNLQSILLFLNIYRFSFSCPWVTIFLHSRELN